MSRRNPRNREPPRQGRRHRDPARHRPHRARRRGARDHGPERLGQEHAAQRAGRPRRLRRSPPGRCCTTARTCWRCRPRSARAPASFSPSSTRSRSPASATPTSCAPRSTPSASTAASSRLDAMDFLALVKAKMKSVDMDPKFLNRSVNEGFSGGEKKRNEILQMAVLEPKLAILDETDSGLDIDALRIVADGVNALRNEAHAVVVITHYQRLLNYLVPDFVHVLADGRIVKSGDKQLARELEEKGYAAFEAPARRLTPHDDHVRRSTATSDNFRRLDGGGPATVAALRERGARPLHRRSASRPPRWRTGSTPTWRRSPRSTFRLRRRRRRTAPAALAARARLARRPSSWCSSTAASRRRCRSIARAAEGRRGRQPGRRAARPIPRSLEPHLGALRAVRASRRELDRAQHRVHPRRRLRPCAASAPSSTRRSTASSSRWRRTAPR